MSTQAPPQLVGVDELRRAWAAVQAGDFRRADGWGHPRRSGPHLRLSGLLSTWTPASGEQVVPVVGCSGSCGATTLAVALATAAGGSARVVECASATTSGLAAASSAELGVDETGWIRGSRDQVLLERAALSRPGDVPTPLAEGAMLTIVDVGRSLEQAHTGLGWISDLIATSPVLVLVARATIPGFRRLESCLDQVDPARVVVGVLGPPRRRWPREVTFCFGRLTRSLADAGRMIEIPEDRHLAVHGLTPTPLPPALITAAAALLALTKASPSDAS